jgi:transposase
VLIANPPKTRLIYADKRKTDKLDAKKLARLARVDPELLYPIEHRGGKDSQTHLALIHSRDALIRSRTQLINHIRGTLKSFVARLPKCSAERLSRELPQKGRRCWLPHELAEALEDLVATIELRSPRRSEVTIGAYRATLQRELYPQETKLLSGKCQEE